MKGNEDIARRICDNGVEFGFLIPFIKEALDAKDAEIEKLQRDAQFRRVEMQQEQINSLEAENKRLRECLEVLADKSKYPGFGGMPEVWARKVASDALAHIDSNKEGGNGEDTIAHTGDKG